MTALLQDAYYHPSHPPKRKDNPVYTLMEDTFDDYLVSVYIDAEALRLPAPLDPGSPEAMRLEAVCEAYGDELTRVLSLGQKLLSARDTVPEGDTVTDEERRLVEKLEAEVDAAFGDGARLNGRTVALYAVRDLLRARKESADA